MSADNYCRWCGRKYDWLNSTASDRGYFCSKRCEVAAHKAGAAPSGRSFESRLDSCLPRCFIILIVLGIIIGMCYNNDENEDKQANKASQRTEQISKTGKHGTQEAQKPVEKVEPVVESVHTDSVQTEEMFQPVSENAAASTNGEASTDGASALQMDEEQVPEKLAEEQVEGLLEESVDETPRDTTAR